MRKMSEQLLLAQKGGIVTDGLDLWVDGRDEIVNGTLLNRVTNTRDANTHFCSPNTTAVPNYIQIPKQDGFNGDGWLSNVSTGAAAKTVEITLYGTVKQLYAFMLPGMSYSPGRITAIGTDCKYAWADNNNFPTVASCATPVHIVAMNRAIYVNGVFQSTNSNFTNVAYGGLCCIRGMNQSDFNAVCIGSMRSYNRALTEYEVLQNYAYEKAIGRAS